MRAKFALSGSRGGIQGAVNATTMMKSPTSPPTIDNGLRRAKSHSSRATERSLGASDASTTTAAVSELMRSVPDPRIEPGIGQIYEDVDDDEDRRVEQHEVLHDDDVALDDRGDERAAEPGHAERLLHGHRATEDEAEQHARDRDGRQHRVRQRVSEHDRLLVGPLRSRGPHVVLADHLEEP